MIHVVRINSPPGMRDLADAARSAARAFFSRPPRNRRQAEFDFDSWFDRGFHRLALGALQLLFNGKCAYCETPLLDAKHVIDWFRPRRGVAENTGEYLGDHYWAQAFEWENLYLSCVVCNRNKANRFPVEGARAAAHANRAALLREHPLLLDPCRDRPEKHLVFTRDGLVSGATERGRTTIEVLDLNRAELVRGRAAEAAVIIGVLDDPAQAPFKAYLAPDAPFVAVKAALVAERFGSRSTRGSVQKAVADQAAFDRSRETAATDSEAGREQLRARARYIESVEIRNVASIAHLTLDLSASRAATTPCFALLGENGIGKSTVLECIALALAGRQHQRGLDIDPEDFIRRGEPEAKVIVRLTGFQEPIEMTVTRSPAEFRFSHDKARTVVLAYGSSRLLPTAIHKDLPVKRGDHAKIANLFDPFLPLANVSRWLARVPEVHFDDASQVMRSLLPGEHGSATFVRVGRNVQVTSVDGEAQPFDALSDGYQSMLGLAADILEIMYGLGSSAARAAQGIVLIDELGNHLHPKWRMRIVQALRHAFPQVQFIYSTHDPLCLKGLHDGEVAVLRRDARKRVYALENLPSVQNLRVDQLLTSEHFGMDSVIDPETDRDLARYDELGAIDPDMRTPEEADEWKAVVARLTEIQFLGHGWRERLALRAVSEATSRFEAAGPSVDAQALTSDRVDWLASLLGEEQSTTAAAGNLVAREGGAE